ncbi:transketolase-like TK C-terminal-containing protein [Streptomyces scabiei]|uniref:transketolase-like TK C-terminal-containing protein n=1 Tax=Streptomyces scabiei TaxID=1930 RepID=UPI0039F447FA
MDWTDLDRRTADTTRLPATDAVQKAGNGRPGTATSLAPATYTLFQKVMRHDPADPESSAGAPEVILIATGSEVRPAVGARERLAAEGVRTRVVSMPSVEWFEEQPREYRERVLPPSVRARVAVEAGIGPTWYRYVGDHGRIVPLGHFGASADAETLFAAYGFASEHVVAAARESPAAVRG